MIQLAQLHFAEHLLRQRKSHRAIARAAQISRGTVATIAAGLHRHQLAPDSPQTPDDWTTTYHRCDTCGALVHLPCLACELREHLRLLGKYYAHPQR